MEAEIGCWGSKPLLFASEFLFSMCRQPIYILWGFRVTCSWGVAKLETGCFFLGMESQQMASPLSLPRIGRTSMWANVHKVSTIMASVERGCWGSKPLSMTWEFYLKCVDIPVAFYAVLSDLLLNTSRLRNGKPSTNCSLRLKLGLYLFVGKCAQGKKKNVFLKQGAEVQSPCQFPQILVHNLSTTQFAFCAFLDHLLLCNSKSRNRKTRHKLSKGSKSFSLPGNVWCIW